MKRLIAICFLLTFLSCKNIKKEDVSTASKIIDVEIYKLENIMLSSGSLFRIDSLKSNYIKPRPVDVWLPEDYSKDKKYAVLYMHDGQMLFDSTVTWNKQEWKVDEWASKLMNEDKVKDFIVVGIWNIRELRNSNYFPEKVFNAMSKKDKDSLTEVGRRHKWINTINSDDYLKFIVEEVKPFIDTHYSCLTDKDNTFVMGSSRGGLISMYAISEYPNVFGGAACLSTHWIGTYDNIDNGIPDAFFDYMKLHLPDSKNHKLYFDYGDKTLDEKYLTYQDKADKVIKGKGHINNIKFPGTDHSEISWGARLDIPLTFLLGNENE
ncbi:alpha/beta hydrolase [Seonamhaeicola maritimus]|uniref:Alpha/beta hydrolase n=1 Tax=Seonamhaeicola maritimus TaxID=2591822 RepID=A0A5C7GGD4_9FLAO|nr:alpha/beta hydrolase-fold protein [Seonamhaeicola maritimus]TXG36644.1 alpha/beta hydrolase [Seonamhaeicola maritimus]